jgi:hypothetical protein
MDPNTGKITYIPEGEDVPDNLIPIPNEDLKEVIRMSFKEKMAYVIRKSLEKKR